MAMRARPPITTPAIQALLGESFLMGSGVAVEDAGAVSRGVLEEELEDRLEELELVVEDEDDESVAYQIDE